MCCSDLVENNMKTMSEAFQEAVSVPCSTLLKNINKYISGGALVYDECVRTITEKINSELPNIHVDIAKQALEVKNLPPVLAEMLKNHVENRGVIRNDAVIGGM